MKKRKISFLRCLRNQEFPEVLREICSIYDVEQINVLYVKESLERLMAHDDELKYIWEMRIPHELTEVLENLCWLRKDYIVSLWGRVKSCLKSPIGTEVLAAKTLNLWLSKHRKYIYIPSITLQTSLVKNLMAEYAVDLKIQEAITSMNLTNVFDSITSITDEIVANTGVRDDEYAENVRIARIVREAAYVEFTCFFKSLDTAINLEEPEDSFYEEYNRKINVRLDKYRTRYLIRIAHVRNARIGIEEGDEGDIDETTDETNDQGDNTSEGSEE